MLADPPLLADFEHVPPRRADVRMQAPPAPRGSGQARPRPGRASLLRRINLLDRQDAGRVLVAGRDLTALVQCFALLGTEEKCSHGAVARRQAQWYGAVSRGFATPPRRH
jgi:hypothetical protein